MTVNVIASYIPPLALHQALYHTGLLTFTSPSKTPLSQACVTELQTNAKIPVTILHTASMRNSTGNCHV
jgi:hypothetical protein